MLEWISIHGLLEGVRSSSFGQYPGIDHCELRCSAGNCARTRKQMTYAEQEKDFILRELIASNYNILRCSSKIGLGKSTIYRKLCSWNLKPPRPEHRSFMLANWQRAVYEDWRLMHPELSVQRSQTVESVCKLMESMNPRGANEFRA